MPDIRKRKHNASSVAAEKPAPTTKKQVTKKSNGTAATTESDAPRVKRAKRTAAQAPEEEAPEKKAKTTEKKPSKSSKAEPAKPKATKKAAATTEKKSKTEPKKETVKKTAKPATEKAEDKKKKTTTKAAEKPAKSKKTEEKKSKSTTTTEKKVSTPARKTKADAPAKKQVEKKPKAETKKEPAKKRVVVAAPPPIDRAQLVADSISKFTKAHAAKPSLNQTPLASTDRVNVYVFGSGSMCELGLGPKVTTVKRPRLNPLLPIDSVGIVKVAVGGGHVIGIDNLGQVWSWGQNDSGVLGRPTKENDDEVEDDWFINSKESTPSLVQGLPPTAVFVEIGATDNLSAAITDDGQLWAWGTFIDDGQKTFKSGIEYQREPVHISAVKNVVKVAGGKDHLVILDKTGNVYTWGVGSSFQLGVAVNSNLRSRVFGPLKVPKLTKIKDVSAGEYHSFAIDQEGKVWSWGLNNFGQAGNPDEAGDGAVIEQPTNAEFFNDKKIVQIAGGNHHSLALTADGEIYAFGEMNFHQLGLDPENLPASTVREKNGTPAYVPVPTKIEGAGIPKFTYVAAGTDHSLAISEDGFAWTWGFGETYQLGHGNLPDEDPEDEKVPKKIENTAARAAIMKFAAAGGQFSVLTGTLRDTPAAPSADAPVAKPKVDGEAKKEEESKDVEMADSK